MPAPVDIGAGLRATGTTDPASVPALVAATVDRLGATDIVVYVVDVEQVSLVPLPDELTHVELPQPEGVATTMAGRAFTTQAPTTADRAEGTRIWVPMVAGSIPSGVLAMTVPHADDASIRACEELGLLAGFLIAAQGRTTDVFRLHQQRKAMSLPASMQWELLPPLVLELPDVSVAGMLEPAYDVGGDVFDYALNGPILEVAIFDAMGHGVRSAMVASLAVGAYRHARREGSTLVRMHARLGSTLTAHFGGEAFATGQLAQLERKTGTLTWVNAGHPCPLLIRDNRVIGELQCQPTLPWGLEQTLEASEAHMATQTLEPGDGVLFYTDGVVDARAPDGVEFGAQRLADLAGQVMSEGLRPGDEVRRLVRAVLDYKTTELRDDASMVLVRWEGTSTNR
ncbi:MAG TPA: PP2C family protein-serine/threonine phosphatase [Acidimicrobiales bacterium]|nr:PP2C family protein-serine/threonine phosphatase [Acidimicrobiales bacterium]